jgi:hypothetical protein
MPELCRAFVLFFLLISPAVAQIAVFWQLGYAFGATPKLQAKRFFPVEGPLNGLGLIFLFSPAVLNYMDR